MSKAETAVTFADSNVVLYLLSEDEGRKAKALEVIQTRPHISVQVLNEVTNICRRKTQMDWDEISDFLSMVRHFCPVVDLTEAIHDKARRLAKRFQFRIYDAGIVAAALSVNAGTLWSEDMQNGQVVEKTLTIKNPFVP
jgi:predicted nucleic acid-binding protein